VRSTSCKLLVGNPTGRARAHRLENRNDVSPLSPGTNRAPVDKDRRTVQTRNRIAQPGMFLSQPPMGDETIKALGSDYSPRSNRQSLRADTSE